MTYAAPPRLETVADIPLRPDASYLLRVSTMLAPDGTATGAHIRVVRAADGWAYNGVKIPTRALADLARVLDQVHADLVGARWDFETCAELEAIGPSGP